MVKCAKCGKDIALPFKCKYCGKYFCEEHRLPEFHDCPYLSEIATIKRQQKSFTTEVYTSPLKPSSSEEYEYEVVIKPVIQMPKPITGKELYDFLIAFFIVFFVGVSFAIPPSNVPIYLAAIVGVILATIYMMHELAHKFTAKYYNYNAYYILIPQTALLTFLFALTPFKMVFPGTVLMEHPSQKRVIGITAFAGPLSNLVLSSFLIPLIFYIYDPFLKFIVFTAIQISSMIALMNLIPITILDGKKIIKWNKLAWTILFITAIVHVILVYSGLLY